jgi:hypothetical protein
MRTEELLEQCLQALTSGEELPPDLARYLARHPEQRAEVEDLLAIAQRVSRTHSPVELPADRRNRMQSRLSAHLGFDPTPLVTRRSETAQPDHHPAEHEPRSKRPLLSIGGVSLAKLRYEPPHAEDDVSEARIRAVFRDLTPDDIRRYIGVRGEDYLYYRQRFPGWEPVFSCIALVLRGMKRLEALATQHY